MNLEDRVEAASDSATLDDPGPLTPLRITPSSSTTPLPSWVKEIRDHQRVAVEEIMDAYHAGVKVVFLDAPTGSGKTLIGELVRRELDKPALYVCSSLTLQDQILHDFPYAEVIKGRSNYAVFEPEYQHRTCADCTLPSCSYCPERDMCPYIVAKETARDAKLAVLNTTYLLFETNRASREFSGRGFVIADECDMLEGELMRFVELRLSRSLFGKLDVEPPKKGQHYTTIQNMLRDQFMPALNREIQRVSRLGMSESVLEELKMLRSAQYATREVVESLADGNWVRDSEDDGGLVMKPISVAEYGQQMLWAHAGKFLCMSATVIDAAQMAQDLGLEDNEWELVTVPMTFPVENRPIIAVGVADMKRNNTQEDEDALIDALVKIRETHAHERILVHSVSYALTKTIVAALRSRGVRTFSYANSGERAKALRDYRSSASGMLVAPSLDRGVDFSGDECRVVVICKTPFPYLGDPQISGKLNKHGGERWYAAQTVRTLVQMTGRGVRSADDHATSYILDKQFLRVQRENKHMFPKWWRDALDTSQSPARFR